MLFLLIYSLLIFIHWDYKDENGSKGFSPYLVGSSLRKALTFPCDVQFASFGRNLRDPTPTIAIVRVSTTVTTIRGVVNLQTPESPPVQRQTRHDHLLGLILLQIVVPHRYSRCLHRKCRYSRLHLTEDIHKWVLRGSRVFLLLG